MKEKLLLRRNMLGSEIAEVHGFRYVFNVAR